MISPPSGATHDSPIGTVGEDGIEQDAPPCLVALDAFSGPLDLLLFLVRRAEVDIVDIPISDIADQFVATVAAWADLDLDSAGDFILMAATLLEIKARLIAPPSEEPSEEAADEEVLDLRSGLVAKLLAYRRCKEAALALAAREDERNQTTTRQLHEDIPEDPDEVGIDLENADPYALAATWEGVLARIQGLGPRTVIADPLPLETAMAILVQTVESLGQEKLSRLFATQGSRLGRVTLLMAVLECVRQRLMEAAQYGQYEDIDLRFRSLEERALASVLPPEVIDSGKRRRRPPLVTVSVPPVSDAGDEPDAAGEEIGESDEQRFLRELEESCRLESVLDTCSDLDQNFARYWAEKRGLPWPPVVVSAPVVEALAPVAEAAPTPPPAPRPGRRPPRPQVAAVSDEAAAATPAAAEPAAAAEAALPAGAAAPGETQAAERTATETALVPGALSAESQPGTVPAVSSPSDASVPGLETAAASPEAPVSDATAPGAAPVASAAPAPDAGEASAQPPIASAAVAAETTLDAGSATAVAPSAALDAGSALPEVVVATSVADISLQVVAESAPAPAVASTAEALAPAIETPVPAPVSLVQAPAVLSAEAVPSGDEPVLPSATQGNSAPEATPAVIDRAIAVPDAAPASIADAAAAPAAAATETTAPALTEPVSATAAAPEAPIAPEPAALHADAPIAPAAHEPALAAEPAGAAPLIVCAAPAPVLEDAATPAQPSPVAAPANAAQQAPAQAVHDLADAADAADVSDPEDASTDGAGSHDAHAAEAPAAVATPAVEAVASGAGAAVVTALPPAAATPAADLIEPAALAMPEVPAADAPIAAAESPEASAPRADALPVAAAEPAPAPAPVAASFDPASEPIAKIQAPEQERTSALPEVTAQPSHQPLAGVRIPSARLRVIDRQAAAPHPAPRTPDVVAEPAEPDESGHEWVEIEAKTEADAGEEPQVALPAAAVAVHVPELTPAPLALPATAATQAVAVAPHSDADAALSPTQQRTRATTLHPFPAPPPAKRSGRRLTLSATLVLVAATWYLSTHLPAHGAATPSPERPLATSATPAASPVTPVTPAALPDVATASAPAQALLPDFRACIDQLRVGPWQAGLPVALASVATGAFAQGVPLRPALETAAVAPATVPAPVATPPHPVPASAPALPAIAPAALVDWLAAGEHAVQAWLPARAPAPTLPPASAPAPGLGSAPAAPVAVPADSSDSAQLQAEAMRALPYAHEAMMSASAWLVIGAWRVDATPADIPLTTP